MFNEKLYLGGGETCIALNLILVNFFRIKIVCQGLNPLTFSMVTMKEIILVFFLLIAPKIGGSRLTLIRKERKERSTDEFQRKQFLDHLKSSLPFFFSKQKNLKIIQSRFSYERQE
jgi:hypothetical protein